MENLNSFGSKVEYTQNKWYLKPDSEWYGGIPHLVIGDIEINWHGLLYTTDTSYRIRRGDIHYSKIGNCVGKLSIPKMRIKLAVLFEVLVNIKRRYKDFDIYSWLDNLDIIAEWFIYLDGNKYTEDELLELKEKTIEVIGEVLGQFTYFTLEDPNDDPRKFKYDKVIYACTDGSKDINYVGLSQSALV